MALQTSAGYVAVQRVWEWMARPLQYAVLRVNTLRITPEEALKITQHCLSNEASLRGRPSPKAFLHPTFRDALVMTAWPDAQPLTKPSPDKNDLPAIVIDATCANAVLRGAPVFHGGILAMSDNISINDNVRIDVFREGIRRWIGYGIVRSDLKNCEMVKDRETVKYEYAVEMTSGMSIIPAIPRELVEGGFAVSQSLPAIVSSHVLKPQPGQRILDFGAGTGFMSSHIAALTSNEAEIIAVDHSRARLDTLVNRCRLLSAKVTPVFSSAENFAAKQTVGFDRIYIHPDHSLTGLRPSVRDIAGRGRKVNAHLREYVDIAVNLLKPGGRLVYYTGSVVPLENDAVVRWLIDKRPDLKLEPAEPRLAKVSVNSVLPTPSWMRLTPDEEKLVQRFGPGTVETEMDPVEADAPGFFIACFSKKQ